VIDQLVSFPSDPEIILEVVYQVSNTMDRRWAEEYIKRRNAAGSGVVIEAGTNAGNGGGGGWNEVAKGRPAGAPGASGQVGAVPETSSAFRVVAGKKKGRR
jgi:PERQ amino acid-rich with GYF domain-containing protein